MTDRSDHIARVAANRLAPEHGVDLAVEVERALHAKDSSQRPDQYFDPISLGSLIVSIASLAWTVYTDLRTKTPQPDPGVIARTIRVRLQDSGVLDSAQHEHIIDIVVDETVQDANRQG
jgi:hypothetical protein